MGSLAMVVILLVLLAAVGIDFYLRDRRAARRFSDYTGDGLIDGTVLNTVVERRQQLIAISSQDLSEQEIELVSGFAWWDTKLPEWGWGGFLEERAKRIAEGDRIIRAALQREESAWYTSATVVTAVLIVVIWGMLPGDQQSPPVQTVIQVTPTTSSVSTEAPVVMVSMTPSRVKETTNVEDYELFLHVMGGKCATCDPRAREVYKPLSNDYGLEYADPTCSMLPFVEPGVEYQLTERSGKKISGIGPTSPIQACEGKLLFTRALPGMASGGWPAAASEFALLLAGEAKDWDREGNYMYPTGGSSWPFLTAPLSRNICLAVVEAGQVIEPFKKVRPVQRAIARPCQVLPPGGRIN